MNFNFHLTAFSWKSVVRNGSASLSVTATGSGLSYQWFSGVSGDTSVLLSGKTSSSYSPPTDVVGQKSYWVRVTFGAAVQDSQTAVVAVIPPLFVITDQPSDRSTFVGQSIYFYCYTNGSDVTYQCYAGVSGDASAPLAGKTSYSFSPPVTVAGSTSYWMRATSGAAHLDSKAAVVTVIGRAPVLTTQPADQQFAEGSGNLSLSASPDDGTGVDWQWYQGESGDTSAPLSGKTGSSLSLPNPVAGRYSYWVRATNPYGSADSRAAMILVTPGSYTHWLVRNGLPSNGAGLAAPGASANDDGVPNLMKYAMGLSASDRFNAANGTKMGTRTVGSNTYLTLGFIQARNSPGAQLAVQESPDMVSWTGTAIECGPSYDNGDGTMTRTFRSSRPMGSTGSGYLRLKAGSD